MIWRHNLVKEKEKEKHFQNMTEGSMFMTFACYSVVWGYEKVFIAVDSLHQIAIIISLVVFLLFLVCFWAEVRFSLLRKMSDISNSATSSPGLLSFCRWRYGGHIWCPKTMKRQPPLCCVLKFFFSYVNAFFCSKKFE